MPTEKVELASVRASNAAFDRTDSQSGQFQTRSETQSTPNRLLTPLLFTSVTAAIAMIFGWAMGQMYTLPDTSFYLMIARGERVLAPFSSRQLGPLIARALHQMFPITIEHAFAAEGVFAIFLLVSMVGLLLARSGVRPMVLTAIAGLSFWPILFNGLVLPDLLFAAFLGVFLWLLENEQYLACGLMLFPLWFTREVAILVLVCFLATSWRKLRPVHYLAAIGASATSAYLVKMLTAGGPGNREHLGFLVYMAGKAPWNLLKNGLGILPWISLRPIYCAVPAWKMNVPFGGIGAIGFCSWDLSSPLYTLRIALASFGLLPVLFVFMLRGKKYFWPGSPMLRFCIVYGFLSIVIAPMIGATLVRYFGYSWPLVIVALPMMTIRAGQTLKRSAMLWFLPAHFAISWTLAFDHTQKYQMEVEIAILFGICALYWATWIVLGRSGATSSRAFESNLM